MDLTLCCLHKFIIKKICIQFCTTTFIAVYILITEREREREFTCITLYYGGAIGPAAHQWNGLASWLVGLITVPMEQR